MNKTLNSKASELPVNLRFPLMFLDSYLFFLTRRPISKSNTQYLARRIHGLKSLGDLLKDSLDPHAVNVAKQLRQLNPSNFSYLAPRLQKVLLPLTTFSRRLPQGFICSDNPPGKNFLGDIRHLLLVLGPGIGIGDEIMFFRVPHWIKQRHPHTQITVLSGYRGLWQRVQEVDHVYCYNDYISILRAFRGEEPYETFDAVVLADFEKPDLFKTIGFEPGVERYVEISSGVQTAVAVDKRNRWLYRTQVQRPYLANYYFGLNYLFQWLGIAPAPIHQFSPLIRRENNYPEENALKIFISPFTSKYDPSVTYWSHLLSSLGSIRASSGCERLNIVLDSGPNRATERFAYMLQRSVKPHLPGHVGIDIAYSEGQRSLTLLDVFREMEMSQVVICADSFAAHAAPLFDCTTLVLASDDLINWRVPYDGSYYFSTESPLPEVNAGIHHILEHLVGQTNTKDAITKDSPGGLSSLEDAVSHFLCLGKQICEAEEVLQEQIDLGRQIKPVNIETLCEAYFKFTSTYQVTIDGIRSWLMLPEFSGLFGDSPYGRWMVRLEKESFQEEEFVRDLLVSLQAQLDQWRNTNLRKYLGMILKNRDENESAGD